MDQPMDGKLDLSLAAHAHEVMHILIKGARVAPDTVPQIQELLEDFSERARPIMRAQLRADLLTTPPDDRDAEWRKQFAITEED